MKSNLYLLLLLILTSCEIPVDFDIKYIESLLEIKLEEGYIIENKEYHYGIGDSVKSFDIVFDEAAFNMFLREVGHKFVPVGKDPYDAVKSNIDYYKNYDFDGDRIYLAITLSKRKLHYSIIDL